MSISAERKSIPDEAHLSFALAAADDIDAVVFLYQSAVGTPGCTWDDEYPSHETAMEDLAAGGLYVLRLDNRIIGAVSVVRENELDELTCFTVRSGAREFARITVSPEFCGRGYARYMLNRITEEARRSGVTAWHILAAVGNAPAIALYRLFSFAFLAECEMYGNRYYIGEMVL